MTCTSPRAPVLTSSDVHVWRIEGAGDAERHLGSLSAAERVRLDRHRGERRRRFAITHGAAREVLSGYLGCAPADVPLACAYGRPPVAPGFALSLAHTEGLGLLALARLPVGVDVEALADGDDDDLEQLAEATLTPAEMRAFMRTAPAHRSRTWVRAWVRKEAALKARGLGLGDQLLCELDVSGARSGQLAIVDVDVGADHIAAIAISSPTCRVRVEEWVDESR
jgi:4'-phosphopantetheinyl transferase